MDRGLTLPHLKDETGEIREKHTEAIRTTSNRDRKIETQSRKVATVKLQRNTHTIKRTKTGQRTKQQ